MPMIKMVNFGYVGLSVSQTRVTVMCTVLRMEMRQVLTGFVYSRRGLQLNEFGSTQFVNYEGW